VFSQRKKECYLFSKKWVAGQHFFSLVVLATTNKVRRAAEKKEERVVPPRFPKQCLLTVEGLKKVLKGKISLIILPQMAPPKRGRRSLPVLPRVSLPKGCDAPLRLRDWFQPLLWRILTQKSPVLSQTCGIWTFKDNLHPLVNETLGINLNNVATLLNNGAKAIWTISNINSNLLKKRYAVCCNER